MSQLSRSIRNWDKHLDKIIADFKDGDDYTLDEDEVDILCDLIKAKISAREGCISRDRCEEILEDIFSKMF